MTTWIIVGIVVLIGLWLIDPKADRERLKRASVALLKELQDLLAPLEQWTQKEQTQAEVEVFILDHLYQMLPTPTYSDIDKQRVAKEVYSYVWNTSTMWAGMGARV